MKKTFARVFALLLILGMLETVAAWPFKDNDETAKPTRDRKKEQEARKNKPPKNKRPDGSQKDGPPKDGPPSGDKPPQGDNPLDAEQ